MKVTFVGLGAMGLPMARCLSRNDQIELTVFDLDESRMRLVGEPVRQAASVAEAISQSDVILSVLPADDHVMSLAEEMSAHGRSGQIYLDFSTVLPQTISAVREQLGAQGIHTVGLGLLRGTPAAQAGTLVLYAGGLDVDRPTLMHLLSFMASDVIDLGTPEAAKALKVANNMVVGCLDALMGEVIAIGEKLGTSADEMAQLLIDEGADSWVLRQHTIPYVLPGDLGPGRFATALMAKDMRLFGRMANEYGCPSRVAAVALAYYRGTMATGNPLDYHPAVVRWLRAGMASGEPKDRPDAAEAIAKASRWVQAAVTLDALAVTAAAGIPDDLAARCMEEGSGGNDALREMLRENCYGPEAFDLDVAITSLAAATQAADAAPAPALFFEMAKLDAVENRAMLLAVARQK